MHSLKKRLLAAACLGSMSACALAAVSAEEAKQLGGPVLTEFGAEKAGNKEGTIPAYTGEGVKPPSSYNPKDGGQRPSPYSEKPLFSITAQNAAQYADKLDGMIAMFKKYPNFRMDIYPTHRTQVYPQYVLDNTLKNATACKTISKELVVQGCYGGFPFPLPKTGAEVMWNHLLAFEGLAWTGITGAWSITSTGGAVFQAASNQVQSTPFFDPAKTTPAVGKDTYWRIRIDFEGPARKVGEKLVVIDAVDSLNVGRRAYQYIPGQRRVKLAPDLAYDTPSPTAGGVGVMDEGKGFLGALDRYDWKLLGKKEKYVMYNNFDLANYKVCPDEKVMIKNFANPDCVRWELHRVWVVEAKLKPGFRHIYHRRVLYWDEDTYSAGSAENYDAAGTLYRISTQMSYPFYEATGTASDASMFYDLQTGQWAWQGSVGRSGWGYTFIKDKPESWYSPETLAGEGIR